MQLSEITSAMQKWSAQRNSNGLNKMLNWLNQGNMFAYNRDSNNQPTPYSNQPLVHVYPGITTSNDLVFFVISAYLDVSTTPNIQNYVQVCPIATGSPSQSGSSGNIPVQQALERIDNWAKDHDNWIQQNIGTTNSIFQAFVIPQVDTSFGTNHDGFLALKTDSSAPGGYTADIIVEDSQNQTFKYFDTVTPCPPFGTPMSGFYLLSLI